MAKATNYQDTCRELVWIKYLHYVSIVIALKMTDNSHRSWALLGPITIATTPLFSKKKKKASASHSKTSINQKLSSKQFIHLPMLLSPCPRAVEPHSRPWLRDSSPMCTLLPTSHSWAWAGHCSWSWGFVDHNAVPGLNCKWILSIFNV